MNIQSSERGPLWFDSVFGHALRAVVLAWLAGAAFLMAAQAWFAPQHLAAVSMITALSGLVAVLALAPGLFSAASDNPKGGHATALMASVVLRLAGTVALFLLCRYQLAASDDLIAAVVVGWYVFLTIVEVTALARRLPQIGAATTQDGDLAPVEISIGSTV